MIMKHFFSLALLSVALFSCTTKLQKAVEIIDLPRAEVDHAVAAAVDSFYNATMTRPVKPDSIELHSVMVVKNGEVIYENWYNGYTPERGHMMFSVSKTFTAVGVGMLIEEGKLALTDKVVDIFPDELPDTVSENLAAMTVRDLLTMTCGHNTEPSGRQEDIQSWVKAFLAWPVEHKPGEYYLYNSYGTFMLSAIVQKITGEKLMDYLTPRLFEPLHIKDATWDENPDGINFGGWGLTIKTEDMAKLGQLFLNEGKWNGKQLVSAEWLKEMSSFQVESSPSGTPYEMREAYGLTKDNNDWVQGYGYQMWMCRHDAFRADGYAGQYIMIFPKRNTVLVLTTKSSLYQPYMDLIWEYLLPVL